MTLRLLFFGAAWAVLVSLGACSKKSDAAPAPTGPLGMSWTIDGTAVKTTDVGFSLRPSTGSGAPDYAILSGFLLADETGVQFTLPYPFVVGTYPVPANPVTNIPIYASYFAKSSFGMSDMYRNATGSITITSVSATKGTYLTPPGARVTGTFSYVATCASTACITGSRRTVTNGYFNLITY